MAEPEAGRTSAVTLGAELTAPAALPCAGTAADALAWSATDVVAAPAPGSAAKLLPEATYCVSAPAASVSGVDPDERPLGFSLPANAGAAPAACGPGAAAAVARGAPAKPRAPDAGTGCASFGACTAVFDRLAGCALSRDAGCAGAFTRERTP